MGYAAAKVSDATHSEKKKNETEGGRTLQVLLVLIVLFLAGGTCAYRYLEQWSYIDALYWSTCTLSTVGFGDLQELPRTGDFFKWFTSVYAFLGTALTAFTVGAFCSEAVDKVQHKRLREVHREIPAVHSLSFSLLFTSSNRSWRMLTRA